MSIKKIQILTPIVTSVNGEFGDVTVDMGKLTQMSKNLVQLQLLLEQDNVKMF